jgi:hypothetical protein
MIALLAYVWDDTLRSQRWVAPVLSFGAVDAILSAQTGPVLPTFAISASFLFFVATWLTVVIINNEDPVQQWITETCAGSQAKVRLSKLLLAFFLATALGVAGMIGPLASAGRTTAAQLGAGIWAQLITALGGVALGALCSRPLVTRRAWSVLAGFTVGLATVVIPEGPPTRQLLVLFNKTGHFALAVPVLLIGLETAALGAVAVLVSQRIALRRA